MSSEVSIKVLIETKCLFKMIITQINFSMMESPSTTDDDDINTGASK